MSYPGVDYGKLAANAVGPTGQFTQGVDPDWTNLANAYGFIQNPFPAMGTEGQDQMRFLATLKNIMDAQLGGPNGAAMQMSPGNPTAAMPFGMRQWFAGASPLFNSVQGRMLMPSTQDTMFQNGYQFGGLDTSQSNALMQLLASQRSGNPVGQNTPANPVAPNASAATATNGATNAAAPPATEGSGQTAAQADQVSGGNTPSETAPSGSTGEANSGGQTAAAATTPTQTPGSGTADIKQGLQQADEAKGPQLGYNTSVKNGVAYNDSGLPVAHLDNSGNWSQSNEEETNSKQTIAQRAIPNAVGQKFSDLGTNAQNILQQVRQLDANTQQGIANWILGNR